MELTRLVLVEEEDDSLLTAAQNRRTPDPLQNYFTSNRLCFASNLLRVASDLLSGEIVG